MLVALHYILNYVCINVDRSDSIFGGILVVFGRLVVLDYICIKLKKEIG